VLSWSAAADNAQLTAYDIYRDATYVATVPTGRTAFTDSTTTPTGHVWTVKARDLAGNVTAYPTAVLSEGFESGLVAPWAVPVTGSLGVESVVVHGGGAAVEAVNSPSWVNVSLPGGPYSAVHVGAWVLVRSRSTSAGFVKLRGASGAYIGYLYVNGSGLLSVRNDAGGVTHVSGTAVPVNQWVRVEVYLNQNPGGPVAIRAALNGVPVTFTGANAVQPGETLGSSGIAVLTLGDDVSSRLYDVVLDDLLVDAVPIP
jgi:hypothetical protein